MSFEDWASHEIEQLASGVKLRRPSPNQSFYKYVGLNTKTSWGYLERTLNNHVLAGSTVNSLNDPFEGKAGIFDDLLTASIDRTPLERLQGSPPLTPAEKTARVAEMRVAAHKYLTSLAESQRIVSFCERSDSPLLWSHYANSYAGACLHFVGRAFNRVSARVGYVSYSTTRPMYPLRLAHALSSRASDTRRRAIQQAESDSILFFTKALDWSYEADIRFLYNANQKNSNEFDSSGLLSIILGPNIIKEDETAIRRLVAKSLCPHLKIRRAKLSQNAFAIDIPLEGEEGG